ncbi:MAG TPA: hypothetical protein H9994_01340 [Candidatus Salinicoccus merdavium]|nr:hypothetical protein [Candidatus Salinicoccus merdavium]
MDGHCHIESTQLTPVQFSRAVMPNGTTGGFFDAHEITNMLGQDGLEYMLEEARLTPLAAYMQVPSSVPSTDCEFETNGAEIGPDEVAEAFSWGDDVNAPGLGAMAGNQNIEAASCNGVNKVVDDQDGATTVKHVYLNSCETSDKAAEIQNTADMNGELADVAGLLPGVFKVMELPPAIASAMERQEHRQSLMQIMAMV